jgi:hypothetical protein
MLSSAQYDKLAIVKYVTVLKTSVRPSPGDVHLGHRYSDFLSEKSALPAHFLRETATFHCAII